LAAQPSAQESLGGTVVAVKLEQNIDDIPVLIYRTPKILLPAVDSDQEFVQIPGIPQTALFLLKTPRIVGSEFPASSPDGCIGNRDPPFCQKIFVHPGSSARSDARPTLRCRRSGGKRCPW
jgi:hypothetical protein